MKKESPVKMSTIGPDVDSRQSRTILNLGHVPKLPHKDMTFKRLDNIYPTRNKGVQKML